jgi:hypothetical protein
MTDEERAAMEKSIKEGEQFLLRDEGWSYVCRHCGWTPQNIGWCDQCGYNRQYDRIRSVTLQ